MRKNKLNVSVSYQELLLVILLMFVVSSSMAGPDDFVFTVDTRISTDNESFTIPAYGKGYKYDVDCDNDGIFEAINQTTAYTCDYSMGGAGRNIILIKDTTDEGNGFPRFRFNEFGEEAEIIELNNWGTGVWDSMDSAFEDAVNMVVLTTDWPDLSGVFSARRMFSEAALANPDTSNWNTSNITDMSFMFNNAVNANPDTSGWNTANVTNMAAMFLGASSAAPNTSDWDTANVTNMGSMFRDAISANPDTSNWITLNVTSMQNMFFNANTATPNTSGWNTTNVINMSGMFQNASIANPDTSGWDTLNVQRMSAMFRFATAANPDTAGWNTGNVIQMNDMFRGANMANPDTSNWDTSAVTTMMSMFRSTDSANPDTSNWNTSDVTDMSYMFAFNDVATPDTSSWDISTVTTMEGMFDAVTLPIVTYDAILNSFATQVVQSNVLFNGGNSKYCATGFRDELINSDGWIITDGGMASESICDELDIIFRSSFEVPVVTFTANLKWFEYDFEWLEMLQIGTNPALIGIGLDENNQAIIKFHVRKVNQQLQIRISDLDIDEFETDTWIEHQWQSINNSGLTEINWLQY